MPAGIGGFGRDGARREQGSAASRRPPDVEAWRDIWVDTNLNELAIPYERRKYLSPGSGNQARPTTIHL